MTAQSLLCQKKYPLNMMNAQKCLHAPAGQPVRPPLGLVSSRRFFAKQSWVSKAVSENLVSSEHNSGTNENESSIDARKSPGLLAVHGGERAGRPRVSGEKSRWRWRWRYAPSFIHQNSKRLRYEHLMPVFLHFIHRLFDDPYSPNGNLYFSKHKGINRISGRDIRQL